MKSLWADAPRNPTDRGTFELARYKPTRARLVSLRPRKKKRIEDLPRVGRRTRRNIKAAREPLILATSLQNTITPKSVAELYAFRWRIELTFRDQKCGRFGLGLDAIRTKQLKRAQAYMLLAVLGHYVAFVLGARVERAGLSRQFQANTVSHRRVLSLPRLGCELLRRTDQLHWLVFLPLHSPPLFKCGDH